MGGSLSQASQWPRSPSLTREVGQARDAEPAEWLGDKARPTPGADRQRLFWGAAVAECSHVCTVPAGVRLCEEEAERVCVWGKVAVR